MAKTQMAILAFLNCGDFVKTSNDTKTKTDNDDYGFQRDMQSTSHYTETLLLMPLATFSHFFSTTTYIVLGIAECEHFYHHCPRQLV